MYESHQALLVAIVVIFTWVCTCLRHIYILWFGFRPRACLIIDLMGTGSTAAAC